QAEDGIRDGHVTGVQTCALPISEKAGALGAFLSGSGSTICAVTLRDEGKVGAAMQRATMTSSQIVITSADNRGVQISSQKSAIRSEERRVGKECRTRR